MRPGVCNVRQKCVSTPKSTATAVDAERFSTQLRQRDRELFGDGFGDTYVVRHLSRDGEIRFYRGRGLHHRRRELPCNANSEPIGNPAAKVPADRGWSG